LLDLYAHATQTSAQALADNIDARYGRRLNVIDGTSESHKGINKGISRKSNCRERESNPEATRFANTA